MSEKSVRAEMHKIVDEYLSKDEAIDRDTLVYKLLETRPSIEGADADFYRVHTFSDLQEVAKSVVGKYKPKDTTEGEILLPGFEHLQRAYPVKRAGKVVIVPVTHCTDSELSGRANQLDEMAKGCRDHARELRTYVKSRRAVA